MNRWRRAAVVALACQLPAATGVPLSRWTGPELAAELIAQGLASAPISVSSLLRILAENPIKPWQYQSWLYPRDPDFAAKARVILDLYQGEPLGPGDRILSTPSRPSRPAAHPRDPARRARPACPCGARVRPPRRARTARRPRRVISWRVSGGMRTGACGGGPARCSRPPMRTAGRVPSLPYLSLDPAFRRGHGMVYQGLARGRVDEDALRGLLVASWPADWPCVFGIDASTIGRPRAVTSPGREFHHHSCAGHTGSGAGDQGLGLAVAIPAGL